MLEVSIQIQSELKHCLTSAITLIASIKVLKSTNVVGLKNEV